MDLWDPYCCWLAKLGYSYIYINITYVYKYINVTYIYIFTHEYKRKLIQNDTNTALANDLLMGNVGNCPVLEGRLKPRIWRAEKQRNCGTGGETIRFVTRFV